jgi:dipeptidyl aminopeptidase/acylaminoacyl peptidase
MKQFTFFLLFLSVLAPPLFGRVAGSSTAERPSAEDFLRMKSFPIQMPLSVSPDGKHVAYTVQDGERIGEVTDPESLDERPGSGRVSRGCEVWIQTISGGEPLRVGDPAASSWGPVWSPNGRMVAFFSDAGGRARAWIWDRDSGHQRPVSDIRPQFVVETDVPRWSADSSSILFRGASDQTNAMARFRGTPLNMGAPPLVLHSPERLDHLLETSAAQTTAGTGMANTFAGDLVEVRIATGEAQTLTRNHQVYGYWPSPDGRRIAYTIAIGYKDGDTDWTLFDLVVRDTVTGHEVIAAHEALFDNLGSAFSWSPDGSRLAYTTMDAAGGTRLWLWTGEHGTASEIGQTSKPSYPQIPLWNPNGDRVYIFDADSVYVFGVDSRKHIVLHGPEHFSFAALFFLQREKTVWSDSPDGEVLYVAERNTENPDLEFHRIHISDGKDERVIKMTAALALLPMDVVDGANHGGLVFPMESPQAPPNLWVVDRGFSGLRQLSHLNPKLERHTFAERRVIQWNDFEGHDLHGTLLLPAGYISGRRYPMVVFIYGGERESRWANQFTATTGGSIENMQLFAAQGYAVFVPDTVMGTATPMLDLFKSLMPGIAKVVETGIVDENAIGVMGHSYGGYSVYSLLVQTDRFRAGVALSGGGNLLSDYGEMDPTGFPSGIAWAEKSQGRMGETPWKVRDKYVENSPFFYLDRVNTPILIAHGDSDWHPAYEDREMFVGLRRLGKTAEYAEYRGAGHRISAWRYSDQLDLATRVLAWFDRYVRSPQSSTANAESDRRNTGGR